MDSRIAAALAASLSLSAQARAQEPVPSPELVQPTQRLVVELRTLPHERPLLLLAPRRITGQALPAVDGDLMLDSSGLELLANGAAEEPGVTRFVLSLLHGIDARLHAQALVIGDTGFRLSPPFVVQARLAGA